VLPRLYREMNREEMKSAGPAFVVDVSDGIIGGHLH
jgi:hypothetical protein